MDNNLVTIGAKEIVNRIYTIREKQVMLDYHLAEIYKVETKVMNQAVKRNLDRFPNAFRFQLTNDESLRFQFGTLETGRGKYSKYLPYVFTEQGVAMLSAVLRSDTAIRVSIEIMNAFVEMRKLKQAEHDQKFEELFGKLFKLF